MGNNGIKTDPELMKSLPQAVSVRLRNYLLGVSADLNESFRNELQKTFHGYGIGLIRYASEIAEKEGRIVCVEDLEEAIKTLVKPVLRELEYR